MVEILTYTYTTVAEMYRLYSAEAVRLRADDNQDGYVSNAEDDVYDDSIVEATDYINLYCEKWYDPSDMAENAWVRRQATYLACHFLSQRRGNPSQYDKKVDQITSHLEKIESGMMQIPRLPHRADFTPRMSNYRVNDRYYLQKIRVQGPISTGGTYSGQQSDITAYYEYP